MVLFSRFNPGLAWDLFQNMTQLTVGSFRFSLDPSIFQKTLHGPDPSLQLRSAPLRSASAQARPRRDRPGAVMLSAAVGCTSKTKQEVTRSHPLEKTELNMSASGSADQI